MNLKVIALTVLLLVCVSSIEEEADSEVENISEFLIQLIEKYDISGMDGDYVGIGAIPVEKYPMFLVDVFLTGNAVSKAQVEVKDSAKELLLEATKGFTAKYNGTEVGVQEFYMDLLKDFTLYLTENEDKYS